jgi:hypothetical protein
MFLDGDVCYCDVAAVGCIVLCEVCISVQIHSPDDEGRNRP